VTQPTTAEDARAAQEKEYSQFVAKETIFIGGARAFNVGDPVPASHVANGVVDGEQVEKTSTKAGQAIVENTKG
jgi:hypothetical protein